MTSNLLAMVSTLVAQLLQALRAHQLFQRPATGARTLPVEGFRGRPGRQGTLLQAVLDKTFLTASSTLLVHLPRIGSKSCA